MYTSARRALKTAANGLCLDMTFKIRKMLALGVNNALTCPNDFAGMSSPQLVMMGLELRRCYYQA
jgi:hypothetical protein